MKASARRGTSWPFQIARGQPWAGATASPIASRDGAEIHVTRSASPTGTSRDTTISAGPCGRLRGHMRQREGEVNAALTGVSNLMSGQEEATDSPGHSGFLLNFPNQGNLPRLAAVHTPPGNRESLEVSGAID
ncbi:MAG: hypothetical protein WCA77_07615 [Thermoplasmata archaeon]